MPVYKTTFQVVVFSDGPYYPTDIEQIATDIDTGDCIGTWTTESGEFVKKENVKSELINIGNDGTFFDEEI